VHTARFAGASRDANRNMDKLLHLLSESGDRRARFRTALSLIWDGTHHLFEGIVEGQIAKKKSGSKGFGYDPIFIPDGHDKTFANLSSKIKNEISHRGRAVAQLKEFLHSKAPQ